MIPLPSDMISPSDAARLARRGCRVLIAGGPSEPIALLDAVAADPDLWQDLCLTGAFVPGVNTRDYSALGRNTRVETIFTTAALAASSATGRVDHLPLHYSDFWSRIARPGIIDIAYAAVPPPAPDGTVGLGLSADFLPAAEAAGAMLVGVVSQAMPDLSGAPRLPLSRFAVLADGGNTSPATLPDPGTDTVSDAIAGHIAGLIPEGGTLQLGLGRLQTAILRRLVRDRRRDLGYHAGMISPAVIEAREVFSRGVTTGVALGDASFYERLRDAQAISLKPVGYTHALGTLDAIPGFVAVNSAFEVDLTGQVNAESLGGAQTSGLGGLADFLRGARASPGGLAVIALSSTTRDGRQSRIVPRLASGTIVSASRSDIDIVVTEHGIADLRDAGLATRADRLRAIADPAFRGATRRGRTDCE
ncbi:acetyl-CoA hydrolase/transferase C-terminal domain-containing protein (plasmid) [Sulfitobacter sp. LCG007]